MILLQTLLSDTTSQTLKVVSNVAVETGIWDSFIIPVAILLFFSLIKYVTGRMMKRDIWFDFAAETAIDILTVFAAFIIGRYFLTSTSQDVLITSAAFQQLAYEKNDSSSNVSRIVESHICK